MDNKYILRREVTARPTDFHDAWRQGKVSSEDYAREDWAREEKGYLVDDGRGHESWLPASKMEGYGYSPADTREQRLRVMAGWLNELHEYLLQMRDAPECREARADWELMETELSAAVAHEKLETLLARLVRTAMGRGKEAGQ
ncbi:MAG: hypothetical protein LUC33_03055 [Prevotellaceae bacterium]|nr:hypothetical protein [Prevotellaceae bacterium]